MGTLLLRMTKMLDILEMNLVLFGNCARDGQMRRGESFEEHWKHTCNSGFLHALFLFFDSSSSDIFSHHLQTHMETFRRVLREMKAVRAWRKARVENDGETASMDAELRERMVRHRKPLLLISAVSCQVFVHGSPYDVLRQFAQTGEPLHPASICLSKKAVLRSIRKYGESRKRKREDPPDGSMILCS